MSTLSVRYQTYTIFLAIEAPCYRAKATLCNIHLWPRFQAPVPGRLFTFVYSSRRAFWFQCLVHPIIRWPLCLRQILNCFARIFDPLNWCVRIRWLRRRYAFACIISHGEGVSFGREPCGGGVQILFLQAQRSAACNASLQPNPVCRGGGCECATYMAAAHYCGCRSFGLR
jgi:hypothetical protein